MKRYFLTTDIFFKLYRKHVHSILFLWSRCNSFDVVFLFVYTYTRGKAITLPRCRGRPLDFLRFGDWSRGRLDRTWALTHFRYCFLTPCWARTFVKSNHARLLLSEMQQTTHPFTSRVFRWRFAICCFIGSRYGCRWVEGIIESLKHPILSARSCYFCCIVVYTIRSMFTLHRESQKTSLNCKKPHSQQSCSAKNPLGINLV